MAKKYTRLTLIQRYQIQELSKTDKSNNAIARQLFIDPSTVSREIERNKGLRGYRYKQADSKAQKRKILKNSSPKKLTKKMISMLDTLLEKKQFSPEQISGYLKLKYNTLISHETIYKYIWRDKKNGGKLYKNLRCGKKKYNKRNGKNAGRGLIPNCIGIEKRDEIVNSKARFGDWEIDTVVGMFHKYFLVTIAERKTQYTKIGLIKNKTKEETTKMTIKLLKEFDGLNHTITSDNGKEFAGHEDIAKELKIKFYFATPYHSWERGLNEYHNKLIRQYFPKKTDFGKLSLDQVKEVEELLNNRPRKTLGYYSPREVILKLFPHLISALGN